MPYSHYDIETLKAALEKALLSGYIYQHNQNLLALQEVLNEDGSRYSNFVQHEFTTDQIGLQFGLRLSNNNIEFLIAITHSNQDHRSEISIGHLKGNQKAFNLCYAFYNYPKHFFVVETDLYANAEQFKDCLEKQLFSQPELSFLDTATKVNPMGQNYPWMKDYIAQLSLEMKVRIQTSLI